MAEDLSLVPLPQPTPAWRCRSRYRSGEICPSACGPAHRCRFPRNSSKPLAAVSDSPDTVSNVLELCEHLGLPYGLTCLRTAPHRFRHGQDGAALQPQGTREGAGGLWLDRTLGQVDRSRLFPWRRLRARSGQAFWAATTRRCAAPSASSSCRAWPSRSARPALTASAGSAGSTDARSTRRSVPGTTPAAESLPGRYSCAACLRSTTCSNIRTCLGCRPGPKRSPRRGARDRAPDPPPTGLSERAPGSPALPPALAARRAGRRARLLRLRRAGPRDHDGDQSLAGRPSRAARRRRGRCIQVPREHEPSGPVGAGQPSPRATVDNIG